MKFLVTKTSCFGFNENIKPCEKATLEDYIIVDERYIDDPMKNPNIGKNWYEKGTDHRVENGNIKRNLKSRGWFIELNTLEELIEFQKEYGSLIIEEPYTPSLEGYLRIEIYDDYRE